MRLFFPHSLLVWSGHVESAGDTGIELWNSMMKNLPGFTGFVRTRNGLDGAGNPCNVDQSTHKNTIFITGT